MKSLIEGGKIDISAFEPFYKKALDGVLTEKDFISFTETQEFRSVDQILKDALVVAERTSDWNLHLESTKEMMNLCCIRAPKLR